MRAQDFLNQRAKRTHRILKTFHREWREGDLEDPLWILRLQPAGVGSVTNLLHKKPELTSSFFSIISSSNSGSAMLLSSGSVTSFSRNKYSPRANGDWSILYALLMSELHSLLRVCSFSVFPENLSGWIWLWNCLNFVVRLLRSSFCCFWSPKRSKKS